MKIRNYLLSICIFYSGITFAGTEILRFIEINNILSLNLRNGEKIEIKSTCDSEGCGGLQYETSLMSAYGSHIVVLRGYGESGEGSHLELINGDTGERYKTVRNVKLSPDKKRIVAFSAGGDAGYDPDFVEIIKIDEHGKFSKEWEKRWNRYDENTNTKGVIAAKWISESELDLTLEGYEKSAPIDANTLARFYEFISDMATKEARYELSWIYNRGEMANKNPGLVVSNFDLKNKYSYATCEADKVVRIKEFIEKMNIGDGQYRLTWDINRNDLMPGQKKYSFVYTNPKGRHNYGTSTGGLGNDLVQSKVKVLNRNGKWEFGGESNVDQAEPSVKSKE